MIRAFQWDLARQVERLDWLLAQLPKYADWGYHELYLHLEDAVEYPSLPGIARADAYSYQELERLVTAAQRVGIGVVPIVNLLGHTQYLIKHPDYRELNELRNADGSPQERGQICPVLPRALDVAEKLIHDMAPFCTAGRMHVGLDESYHLGKHPLSRREIERIGLAGHFARYVNRLHGLVSVRGLQMGIWADMLVMIPDAIPALPRGIAAYDWYYYPFDPKPRFEPYNYREYDLAPALKARGIDYWGCPMNGAFRFEPLPHFKDRLDNIDAWWRRCRTVGATGFLVTSWEAYRLAVETTTAVDAAAATLWCEPNAKSQTRRLETGFRRAFGLHPSSAKRWARTVLAMDRYAFAGYARWEVNQRWDVVGRRRRDARWAREETALRRLEPSTGPEPLSASVRFRRYLAVRDRVVREAAWTIFAARRTRSHGEAGRLLKTRLKPLLQALSRACNDGAAAARTMWNRTRRTDQPVINLQILAADRERLAAAEAWLETCRRTPGHVLTPNPFCGAWQLMFVVENTKPAVQRIEVRLLDESGAARTLAARHTIEFTAIGGGPRARGLQREFGVSIPLGRHRLSITCGGIGEVWIKGLLLTDGITEIRPSSRTRRLKLGRPAPRSGFVNPAHNEGSAAVMLDYDTNDARATLRRQE